MKLFVFDDDSELSNPSSSPDSIYICYASKNNFNCANVYYIYDYIDANRASLIAQLSNYCYSLYTSLPFSQVFFRLTNISPSFSSLWITKLQTKNYIAAPGFFDPILRFLAIRMICRIYNFESFNFKVSSLRERYVLSRFFTPYKFSIVFFKYFFIFNDFFTSFLIIIPSIVRSLLFGVKHFLISLSIPRVVSKIDRFSNNSTLFVAPFTHIDQSSFSSGSFESNFWTHLPEFLNIRRFPVSFLHFYISSDSNFSFKSAWSHIKSFNRDPSSFHSHFYLFAYLTIPLIIKFFCIYCFYLVKALFVSLFIFIHSILAFCPIFSLVRPYEISSLFSGNVYSSFLFHLLFCSFIDSNKHISSAYLIGEFLPWELSFISACSSSSNRKITTTLVNHSTIREWDLRYFSWPEQYSYSTSFHYPSPSFLAVNSEHHFNLLSIFGLPQSFLIRLEALRFMSFATYDTSFIHSVFNSNRSSVNVLVAGDSYVNHTSSMVDSITRLDDNLTYFKFFLRQHPSFSDSRFNSIPGFTDVTHQSFYDSLINMDLIILSPTTSCVIAALYLKIPCIQYQPNNCLNLSPFSSFDLPTFSDYSSLQALLNSYIDGSLKYSAFMPNFFLDSLLPKWFDHIKAF